jgi:ATPase subunit of ABC transporter with duplicated ATPase domains
MMMMMYSGDYTTFEKVRAETMLNQKKAYEAQKVKRDHVQKFIGIITIPIKNQHHTMVTHMLVLLNRQIPI